MLRLYLYSALQSADQSNECVNPYPAKLIYLIFHPLENVSRYRDPQLQSAEKYSYLFNFRPNICKSWYSNAKFSPNINELIS